VRILLVDDDPLTIRAMRTLLEQDGHTVLTAQSALDAITAMELAGEIGAAIIDFELGSTLSGNDVAVKLQKKRPHCARFLCSAHSIEEVRAQWRDPFEGLYRRPFFQKPIDREEIRRALWLVERSDDPTPPDGLPPEE
jgi:CheY-like chemotaxis protein